MSIRSKAIGLRIGEPQTLLLSAALSDDKEKGAEALAAWWKGIPDFDAVRGTDAALFPRIYANLGLHIRDRTLAARMKGAARHHWLKNQYLITACGDVLERLDRAGIKVLLMKGAAIAAAVDDDPGLRAMSDCDLLVPRERALDALRVLDASKRLETVKVTERDLDIVHGATLKLRGNRHATFDLHWHPLRAIGADELAREMFAQARQVRFAGQPRLAPCPEHQVFHAIVHGVDWSIYPRYDWLIDTARILRRNGDAFDWQMLAKIARRYGFGYLIGSALAEAQARTNVKVPRGILRDLRLRWAPLERLEMKARLSKPSAHSTATEMLLAAQQLRRRSARSLRRPALCVVPTLLQSLYGSPTGSRSFIDNDRNDRITFLLGWSAPEQQGRWTEGRHVSFAIFAPERPRPKRLVVRALALPAPGMGSQQVDVFAGRRHLKTLAWPRSATSFRTRTIRLPSGIWRGDTAVLRFVIGQPVTPIEVDLNGDTRALGLFVQTLSVDPLARDAIRSPLDLSRGGSAADAMWQGWATPEPEGCWTIGRSARIVWRASQPVPAGSRVLIEINTVAPGIEPVTGSIRVNDRATERFSHAPEEGGFTVALPIGGAVTVHQEMSVRLQIDNPRAPAQYAGGTDGRSLGLFVRRVWIEPPPA
jgi:hypothetical protein